MKVTFSVSQVTGGTGTLGFEPAAGAYLKVPATFAVASSWVELSFVPYVIGEGVAQVRTGLAFLAVVVCLAEAAL